MTVPLCKNCKWFSFSKYAINQETHTPEFWGGMCGDPDNVDLVTGELVLQDAHDMRNDRNGGRCGREARLFVQKE
jgi:hypothetical protein